MKIVLLLAVAVVSAMPLGAQVSSPPRKAPAATEKPKTTSKPADPKASKPKPDSSSGWRPYRFSVFSSDVVDSNIDRDKEDPIASNGFIAGVGARYHSAEIKPAVQIAYEIARHSYTHSEQYDRVSHNLSAVLTRRFSNKLTGEAITEAALKGSSEDRDVGDQYIFLPRLNYRLDQGRRVRVYSAYRIRRYDDDTDRNAVNRYVGTELRSDIGDAAQIEFGFRYETNSANAVRRSYTRRTYQTTYTRSRGDNDDFLAELRYQSQRYDGRPVSEDNDNPRHDHRLSPTIEWVHRFGRGLSLIANYDFEHRRSNDPDNGYRDHVFALTGRYDW